MKYLRTFTLFSFEGIELKVSWSFQLFVLILFSMLFLTGLGEGFLHGLVLATTVVFCVFFAYSFVVVHEYGHALAAKHLGYKKRDISLYPMAGLASISGEWHKNPWHEFIITIWGPITNLVMGALAFGFLQFCEAETLEHAIVNFAFKVNFSLLLFNLIPAYPMDGGRILCSAIGAISKDWWTGTVWATRCSFVCGLVAIPLGFYFQNPIAGLMIGFMGLFAAQAEMAHLKNLREIEQLEEERLALFSNLMRSESLQLYPDDPVRREEFVEIMMNFHKFLMRFINWAVREKIPIEDFEKMIAYLFTQMKDAERNREMNAKAAFDENGLFEEIREAANEYRPVVGDAQLSETQRESA
jgi:Zn-dependent protease